MRCCDVLGITMSGFSRRAVLVATAAACGGAAAREVPAPSALRIGLTPVFLDNQVNFLNLWRRYLEDRLQRPVQLVQRGSYRDIVVLLLQDQLDFAWLCGYPFVRNERRLRLLAVPLYRGAPLYQSYLIVPSGDAASTALLDLRGKVFAYSDPDSNSGHLYTLYSLKQLRQPPSTFFAKAFFTWGHRKVVDAVAVGLAQGGAVDGYVWDTLALRHPELTARTRIVDRSPVFGFPPFVARADVGEPDFKAMQGVLLRMRDEAQGAELLAWLNLDGFQAGTPALYDSVRAMARVVDPA
jgi:phosphonate transport system substrate-binding protein